ncbi:MAG: hypothetical protein COA73_09745 [Candidatus Hydrogenedentota bacterium]|nr:MAG: hypothetical protein COA73_09745 [Candidatus Hydrogenedentota bacterium]
MSNSPINVDRLLDRFEYDRPFLQELFGIFLESMEEHLGVLDQANNQHDAIQGREAAHIIAGASANVGAEAVNASASKLESHYISKDVNAAAKELVRLKEECTKTKVFILDYLKTNE